ncbi:MAG: 2-C-methyl-D-erythritol 2,4-cyclodiphosphate synthase [Alicyclobacillus sp.]|nr:2-C-methyl-D-erythritol 2,4-cyclodiphosphate synthase [Alicyclobacillus sp.]
MCVKIGFGFDVHPTERGRRMVLGGVDIPCEVGLAGHSDADVVAHATMDAVLGALALGDIGHHFPDSDPRYRGADSILLLRQVRSKMEAAGYEIGNLDLMVLAEVPRLAPYKQQMRANLAQALGCTVEQVSVKATTMEGLGFIGQREGVAAQAVVLLQPKRGV